MHRLVILIISLSLSSSVSAQTDTSIYTLVMAGNTKGFYKEWKNADGSYGSWYQFNDRGRGDSIIAHWKEDGEGFPIWISAGGKDYMKNNVSEEFTLTNGIAQWKNKSEDEKMNVSGKKFFQGLLGYGGNLSKALRLNNYSVELIPYGKILREKISDYTVDGKKLVLFRTTGFGMIPEYAWIDEGGNKFASVSEDWLSSILKGNESMVPKLLEIQQKEVAQYFKMISSRNNESSENLLIRNVNIFDSEKGITRPGMDILIKGGKVSQISSTGTLTTAGRVIEGKGMTAVPGLWDMHVHFAGEEDGILHMAAGVTHIRDMGNDTILLKKIRDINDHSVIGPKVEIKSGIIDGAGPLAAPAGALINNVDEGKKAVQDYASKGYQQIKFYSSVKPEWVKPLIDEAVKNNMRVSGHIPAFMTATQAVNAGYNEITHMNMLALNFFGDTVDTRSRLRLSLPAQKSASLDLDGEEMQTFIALLKSKNIAVDPTIGVFERLFLARDGVMEEKYNTIVNRYPVLMQREIKSGGGGIPVPEGMDATYKKSYQVFEQILMKLYNNNITILAGTDGFPGFDFHRELELYVKAGLPPQTVLQIATINTARYVKKDQQLGSIKIGNMADIVLVKGNPAVNISDIRNTRYIISGNTLYESAKLYEALSIKPQ